MCKESKEVFISFTTIDFIAGKATKLNMPELSEGKKTK